MDESVTLILEDISKSYRDLTDDIPVALSKLDCLIAAHIDDEIRDVVKVAGRDALCVSRLDVP